MRTHGALTGYRGDCAANLAAFSADNVTRIDWLYAPQCNTDLLSEQNCQVV